jgi:hypothetical protein
MAIDINKNIIHFPGATDPAPEPEIPASVDPFTAIVESLGRSLMDTVGDMTVGEALEQLARMPAKAVLRDIFGLNNDQGG